MIEKSQYPITCLHYEPDTDDINHWECLWADFIIDPFHTALNIRSDCGNLQYQWNSIGNQPFSLFLANISREYFLRKLSRQTVFNFGKTVQNLLVHINHEKQPNYYAFIESIAYFDSEDQFAAIFCCP